MPWVGSTASVATDSPTKSIHTLYIHHATSQLSYIIHALKYTTQKQSKTEQYPEITSWNGDTIKENKLQEKTLFTLHSSLSTLQQTKMTRGRQWKTSGGRCIEIVLSTDRGRVGEIAVYKFQRRLSHNKRRRAVSSCCTTLNFLYQLKSSQGLWNNVVERRGTRLASELFEVRMKAICVLLERECFTTLIVF